MYEIELYGIEREKLGFHETTINLSQQKPQIKILIVKVPLLMVAQSAAGENSSDDKTAFFRRGCCCFFNVSYFKSGKSDDWERISSSCGESESIDRSWWGKGIDGLKKVREWSELVAGPRWKTFIRRFNKSAGKAKPGKFQYDPLSYALNFDDGREQDGEYEADVLFRNFSSPYAAIPAEIAKLKESTASTPPW